jgi:hypothetical protein
MTRRYLPAVAAMALFACALGCAFQVKLFIHIIAGATRANCQCGNPGACKVGAGLLPLVPLFHRAEQPAIEELC